MNDLGALGGLLGNVALTLPRIAAAFMILPFFGQDSMPGLVRNSFFVSLAIVVVPLALAGAAPGGTAALPLAAIVAKEIFIGLMIGFAFGIVFWALGIAGEIIDMKSGANIATVVDPLGGHQTTLSGAFYARLAGWLFMASGGLLVFLEVLLGSYAIWPVASSFPQLDAIGEGFVIDSFARLMAVALLLAAPALVVLLLADLALGIVNRYAPQLNAFALSLGVKAWLSVAVMFLTLGVFVEFILRRIAEGSAVLETLRRLF